MRAADLRGAVRSGGDAGPADRRVLARRATGHCAVTSFSSRGRQQAQAPQQRALRRLHRRSPTAPLRARVRAARAKLRASTREGNDGAHRASTLSLARACGSANGAGPRQDRGDGALRARLAGTVAGARPGLARGRGRGARYIERV